jgi:DNA-binding SARP family transcriptional activator
MKSTKDALGLNSSQERWRVAVELLQMVQSDYQRARAQLEEIRSTFGERETMVGEHLRTALQDIDQPKQRLTLDKKKRLQVYCLGSFDVRLDGERIERWRSLKAKSVLKYLVSQRRQPVSKDVLMERLWPEWDPDLANNNLKAAMHALRQTLSLFSNGENDLPYILFREGNYLINPEVELWLDTEEFEQQWNAGRRLEREGRLTKAIREYELAEKLYRGDYLEDDLYEEWTLLRREALKDTYLAILGKLSDHSMAAADYESCIVYSQKILAKDSCREDAYRRLMCCYSRLGQRNRALYWFKICEKIIKAELDTSPDRETAALYHQMLKGEPI